MIQLSVKKAVSLSPLQFMWLFLAKLHRQEPPIQWEKEGVSRHPCLVPAFSKKTLSFTIWWWVLGWGSSLYSWFTKKFSLSLSLKSGLDVEFCPVFPLHLLGWPYKFFFSLLKWWITPIDFRTLYKPDLPRINHTWYVIHFIHCWFPPAEILFLHWCWWGIAVCSFLVLSLVLVSGECRHHRMRWKIFPPPQFFFKRTCT